MGPWVEMPKDFIIFVTRLGNGLDKYSFLRVKLFP